MCAFALSLLPLIPTSVICETYFSRYNSAMRADRSSLNDGTQEAMMIMTNSGIDIEKFDLHISAICMNSSSEVVTPRSKANIGRMHKGPAERRTRME